MFINLENRKKINNRRNNRRNRIEEIIEIKNEIKF